MPARAKPQLRLDMARMWIEDEIRQQEITHQSCDKGNPEMPEAIVQQPTVHYVSKESNVSGFTQPVSWFRF